MKNNLFVVALIFCYANFLDAQTLVPQIIPCLTITPTNLTSLGTGIAAVDCIETDGNVNFNTDQHYSIKAGEYISFGQETVISPDVDHQFHAYIENEPMDIAWYTPNATPGTVGQFEKLELGVQFASEIQTKIENFTSDPKIAPMLNPFNPEQVDLQAHFWWYSDGSIIGLPPGWYGPQLINGFYYDDFIRDTPNETWIEQNNEHQFRIRFAPRNLGLWRCQISATIAGYGTFYASDFTFNCVPSGSKDFMRVGDNGQFFKIGDEPFFPVGHNVTMPRPTSGCCAMFYDFISDIEVFEEYEIQLEKLATAGANYVRIINNPVTMDIEFEKLNDYSARQVHAWELDNIFKTAGTLNLRVHFDLLIQNYFDVPHAFGANYWDWSAYGDTLNDICTVPNDAGYCYRSELNLEHPQDFFSNAQAIKFYKYKLRYLIARYGYYTEIAVLELQSEINNVAVYHPKEILPTGEFDVNGNPKYGCFVIKNEIYNPYKENEPGFIDAIYAWQTEMCRYIKEDLAHTNHPLAVSYAGEPTITVGPVPTLLGGDLSFASNFVDIMTYNDYARSIEKWHNTVDNVQDYAPFNKPLMFSEFGPGDGTPTCDNGSDFFKTVILSPFTGVAGSAMNWDWQYPGQEFYWNIFGPTKNLMEGIKLDEENWQAMPPQVFNDNKVEMLHLRSETISNNQCKVVGAISNRTYNYYTQSPEGSICKAPPLPALEYTMPESFVNGQMNGAIQLENMGINKQYHVEWFNALTGDFLLQQEYPSKLNGDLELTFPGILTGNEVSPILFFTVHPAGGSLKMSEQDTTETEKTIVNLPADTAVKAIKPTVWGDLANQNSDLIIHVSPNPTSDILNVSIEANSIENCHWYLMSEKGDILITGILSDKNFVVDLGSFESGTYYFVVEITFKDRVITKIVKI